MTIRFDHTTLPKAFMLAKRMSGHGAIKRFARYNSWMVNGHAREWLAANNVDYEVFVSDGENDTLIVFDDATAMKIKLRFG